RVERRQEVRQSAAFKLPTLAAGLTAARALLVRGGRPVELAVAAAGTMSLHADGPEPLTAAEIALAERVAGEHRGEPLPHTPPPRIVARPYERAVPLESIDREVAAPALVGDAVRVVGWHVGGACVIDTGRAPAPPPPPPPFYEPLKKRLDPHDRFVAWPERLA
ncbi:MAG TPA: hypothetical protein VF945_14055, partial [Polyangia bacterium]